MEPQNIVASSSAGTLVLSWYVIGKPVAVLVSIASDSLFTQQCRTFMVPVVGGITLDCGHGFWYIRVGSLHGDNNSGAIEWSGVYGPCLVNTSTAVVPIRPSNFSIVHTQPITNGHRIHTGLTTPHIAILEYSTESAFPITGTKWRYMRDVGRGYVDCMGLEFPHLYNIRATLQPGFPTDSVVQLLEGRVARQKHAARPLRHADSSARIANVAGEIILREAASIASPRFASNADYVRYIAARARNSE